MEVEGHAKGDLTSARVDQLADAATTGVKHLSATDPADAPAEGSEEEHSPEALGLTESSASEREQRFAGIMGAIEEIGEGPEAAVLVAQSYEGRDLEAEGMASMDATDHMPHPGDAYLPPQAVPSRALGAAPASVARLNASTCGACGKTATAHPVLPLRTRAAGGGCPPPVSEGTAEAEDQATPSKAATTALTCGAEEDMEAEAMQGIDALSYASEHAAVGLDLQSVDCAGLAGRDECGPDLGPHRHDAALPPVSVGDAHDAGVGPGFNTEAAAKVAEQLAKDMVDEEELYDVERDALKGSDAMFY